MDFLRDNSAAIATAIRSVILCAIAFGLEWTADQIAATMLAVESVLAVIVGKTTVAASKVERREAAAHERGFQMGTGNGTTHAKWPTD